jgi:hypothetical protein
MMGFWISALLAGVAFGGTAAFIAANKNRDSVGWFCLGFLFTIFALVAICAVPAIANENSEAPSATKPTASYDKARPWLRG